MESRFKKELKYDEENEIMEEADEIDDMIDNIKKMPCLSKFSIPSGKQNSNNSDNNFTLPRPKLRDYSPIEYKIYFPNQEYVGDIPIYWRGDKGPILLCLHGAGHSGLSFSHLAKDMKDKYRVVSFDFRGHGYNKNQSSDDLSQNTLIEETLQVMYYLNEKFPDETFIIIGHSMGGSIAVKAAAEILKNEDSEEKEIFKILAKKICGLIVIDVVEGSAIEALPYMENIVKQRPKWFKNVDAAIEYMYKSGTIKNLESARMSVPSLVSETIDKKTHTTVYKWKTDLLASQKYWTEWFNGLTKCFLSIRIPKVLLLAASDRMDTQLTIAQMQGKFKLSIINNVGHIIHEDDSKAVADMINEFVSTFKIPGKSSEIKPIIGYLGSSNPTSKKYQEHVVPK